MPLLRCTDPDCGETVFRRSWLAEGSECEHCGEPTEVVEADDDVPAELQAGNRTFHTGIAHTATARKKARQVLSERGITSPPVPVSDIARHEGFTVRRSSALGDLRARLLDDLIEVNAAEPPVAQRFSIAHELGHYFLGSAHGDDTSVEREADAFAGELLIPGFMLSAAIATDTSLRRLARRFGVSTSALRISAETHRLASDLS